MRKRTLLTATVLAAGTYLAIRPKMRRFGATDEDLKKKWPADEMFSKIRRRDIRTIDIAAPAATVWRWIVQIGQDRAGFYSYTFLENLFGAEMKNTFEIRPEWQERYVGQDFWMTPKSKFDGQGRMVVAKLIPNRVLVLVPPDDAADAIQNGIARHGAWSFYLEETSAQSCRLIMHTVVAEQKLGQRVVDELFWEPAHFVMERKMMREIKRHAEAEWLHLEIADAAIA